ncbi:MAG TPA: sugar porter family MFS transporter [Candidatus Dormibacteraeota bacterium]|jgi:sugar porter (SP) family MFS transporter|nr:sugar porter family MFS transporter [Candidatus Dormibacteraeota bacterium]
MSEETVGRPGGFLAALDTRHVGGFYVYLAVLATIGGFLFGYDTANIGSALPFLPFNLGAIGIGIVVSGASVGAAVGAISAGPVTDRFGRKYLLILDSAIFALGAILSAVAWNAAVLDVARIVIGLAIGADSAIATAYISEFAPKNRRGSLSIIQQWMITVGILVAYIIAVIVLEVAPHATSNVDWRLLLGLGAIPALVSLALRARMPESPRWLLLQGRNEDVKHALHKLGMEVTDQQVTEEVAAVRAQVAAGSVRSRFTPAVRRALIVICVWFTFQQITGINVAFYYGPHLLMPYFVGPHTSAVQAEVSGVLAATVLAIVNVISTFFAFRYIDRVGRRLLGMGAYTGMFVFLLVGAAGAAYLHGVAQLILIMVGFALFIACFAIGVGGTGWLLQGEVFPTSVRGTAASIGATVDWLANYVLVLVYPIASAALGLPWVMVIFAVLCVFAVLFINRFVPETKGLAADDVIKLFDGPVKRTRPSTPSTPQPT